MMATQTMTPSIVPAVDGALRVQVSARILRKLAAGDRTQAVAIARQRGVLAI